MLSIVRENKSTWYFFFPIFTSQKRITASVSCTPRSRISPCREDRRCTPLTCVSPFREGRGCTPRTCVSPCRESRGCTPRSCI